MGPAGDLGPLGLGVVRARPAWSTVSALPPSAPSQRPHLASLHCPLGSEAALDKQSAFAGQSPGSLATSIDGFLGS